MFVGREKRREFGRRFFGVEGEDEVFLFCFLVRGGEEGGGKRAGGR